MRTHTKRGEGGRLSLVRIPSVFGNCYVIYHEGVPKDEKQCVHLRYGPGIEISRWRMNEQRHLQKEKSLICRISLPLNVLYLLCRDVVCENLD